jgi:hypothetical protein
MSKKLHPLRVETAVFEKLKERSKELNEPLTVLVTRLLAQALEPAAETATPFGGDLTSLLVRRSTKDRVEAFSFAVGVPADEAAEKLTSVGWNRLNALAKYSVTGGAAAYKERFKKTKATMKELAEKAVGE